MQTFEILNSDGNVINLILADESFVEAHYSNYRAVVEVVTDEEIAAASNDRERGWRDSELKATDYIPSITDHPQRSAYLTYRTALRDWPSTSNFPDTRPTLGS